MDKPIVVGTNDPMVLIRTSAFQGGDPPQPIVVRLASFEEAEAVIAEAQESSGVFQVLRLYKKRV